MKNVNVELLFLVLLFTTVLGGLFLFWPRQVKVIVHRYAPYFTQKRNFFGHYLLGVWPLFQFFLFLLLQIPIERAIVITITSICILFQYFLLIIDRMFLEKICVSMRLSKQQMRSIDKSVVRVLLPNFYGFMMNSIGYRYIGNWGMTQEINFLINWLPLVCAALYIVIAVIGVLLVRRTRKHLILAEK